MRDLGIEKYYGTPASLLCAEHFSAMTIISFLAYGAVRRFVFVAIVNIDLHGAEKRALLFQLVFKRLYAFWR